MVKALLPSATATPQPRGVFWNSNVKIYFSWEIGRKSGGNRVRKKAVRFHLIDNNGQLRRAKSPACKNPHPFFSSSLSLSKRGLHSLFAGFRTLHPSVVFFCHTFCNPPYIHSVVFSKPLFQSTHKSKKTLCIPTATTMHACARKKQLKAIIHNM